MENGILTISNQLPIGRRAGEGGRRVCVCVCVCVGGEGLVMQDQAMV